MTAQLITAPLPAAATAPASLDGRLKQLAAKYAVTIPPGRRLARRLDAALAGGGSTLVPGWAVCGDEGEDLTATDGSSPRAIPLAAWQSERRFIELRNLITNQTVEHVCLWRSRCLSGADRWSLAQALYREIGLMQWVLGAPLASVYLSIGRTSTGAEATGSLVGRLTNGVACGIEVALTLPLPSDGSLSPLRDRHEAICRRGVASDQVVDSVFRPSSVYVMTDEGTQTFLDTDDELFGLAEDEVALVREAMAQLCQPAASTATFREHERLCRAVATALNSAQTRQRMDVDLS